MFIVKRLRKGCNSTIMNFSDMGLFENSLVTHDGNIGFNISGPPGSGIGPIDTRIDGNTSMGLLFSFFKHF